MRKILLITAFLAIGMMEGFACGICGCIGGFSGLGYVPGVNMHYIGLNYDYTTSTTRHPLLFPGDKHLVSYDRFHTLSLTGRYVPHEKVLIHFNVPYRYNIANEDGELSRVKGFGDPMILVNYKLYTTPPFSDSKVQHMVLVGAGVQFPIGKNDFFLEDDIWAPGLQAGVGSFSFPLNLNYTMLSGDFGFNSDISSTLYTANNRNYKYATRYEGAVTGFYNFLFMGGRVMTHLGVSGSYKDLDILNVEHNIVNDVSGGWQVRANVGLDLYYVDYGIRAQLEQPVMGSQNAGYTDMGRTFSMQFYYFL